MAVSTELPLRKSTELPLRKKGKGQPKVHLRSPRHSLFWLPRYWLWHVGGTCASLATARPVALPPARAQVALMLVLLMVGMVGLVNAVNGTLIQVV